MKLEAEDAIRANVLNGLTIVLRLFSKGALVLLIPSRVHATQPRSIKIVSTGSYWTHGYFSKLAAS